MIQITRSGKIPRVLTGTGKRQTDLDIALFEADEAGFGVNYKINFRSSVYNAKSVKKALIKIQDDKCCFCESKISHASYGDVEHFRPKAGYRQDEGDALQRPGYFWLAYSWSNLLFCCQICNQRFKRNTFPVVNPVHRATKPKMDLSLEEPFFVNPADEDPKLAIGFRGDTPYAIGGSPRGHKTIAALGLEREALRSRRAALLEKLKLVYMVAHQVPANPLQQDARALLAKAADSNAEYSSAVSSAVADGFQFV